MEYSVPKYIRFLILVAERLFIWWNFNFAVFVAARRLMLTFDRLNSQPVDRVRIICITVNGVDMQSGGFSTRFFALFLKYRKVQEMRTIFNDMRDSIARKIEARLLIRSRIAAIT